MASSFSAENSSENLKSDGNAEGRAGDVVEADVMTERCALRFAPMLAADTQLDVGPHFLGRCDRHLHQLADARLVDGIERIGGQDLLLDVGNAEDQSGGLRQACLSWPRSPFAGWTTDD